MFVGHFAVGLGAKRIAPQVSLGTLVLAAMLADLLWCVFMLAGFEHVTFGPGLGAANYIVSTDMPYSHSLATGVVWGAFFAAGYFLLRRDSRRAWLLAAVVLSHWFLDAVSHPPDMPLAPGVDVVVGLGLWKSVPATLVVEGGLWVVAIVAYLSATTVGSRAAAVVFWIGAILLTILWRNNIAGPPPPPGAVPVGSLITFLLAVGWAYWVNWLRSAPARTVLRPYA